MKVTITFELPKDFTEAEIESFQDSISTAAFEAIKDTYESRGRDAAEDVAASMKIDKTKETN